MMVMQIAVTLITCLTVFLQNHRNFGMKNRWDLDQKGPKNDWTQGLPQ